MRPIIPWTSRTAGARCRAARPAWRSTREGTMDDGFRNGVAGAKRTVLSVAVQSDGKVLIGGLFSSVNGTARGRIARLNSDGTLDAGFQNGLAGANSNVQSVAAQSD